jgi:hypothetical protein
MFSKWGAWFLSPKIIDNGQSLVKACYMLWRCLKYFLAGMETSELYAQFVSCVEFVMNTAFMEGTACVSDVTSFYNILGHCNVHIFFI